MEPAGDELSHRERALLRAIGEGRGELIYGCEPDLAIDGYWCGDQSAAHHLAQRGLIAPAQPTSVGSRVAAVLTAAGIALLSVRAG
ncbi:MAG: hypothetical protein GEU98_18145 [Pseudonocardiaceae bacterium]|nr:hypothetical protein [Pseudonocardiaceae bacterium]